MSAAQPKAKITAIDAASVHRICSGQVILDPSSALKELVENSADAGATRIEIRLKEFGLETLEVSDNGQGIKPEDYEMLAMKHTTSKLSNFEDISRLETFGFRGEALSSLCAISESVTIITRTKDQSVATKLQYDRSGKLKSATNHARDAGTSVILEGLFQALPVRYKDFMKNKTREYQRLLRRLQAYTLIHTSIRFSCSNQTAKGRSTILSTPGNGKILDSFTSIFGARVRDSLTDVKLKINDEISVDGMMSKASGGCGLSSTDRQFMFLNKRPVDIARLSKMLNEVYKSYNMHQYPMYVLNITMPTDAYDVNVTPDKRSVMIPHEQKLVDSVKEQLKDFFEPSRYTLPVRPTQIDQYTRKGSDSQNPEVADSAPEVGTDEVAEVLDVDAEAHCSPVVDDSSDTKRDSPVSRVDVQTEVHPGLKKDPSRNKKDLRQVLSTAGSSNLDEFSPSKDASSTLRNSDTESDEDCAHPEAQAVDGGEAETRSSRSATKKRSQPEDIEDTETSKTTAKTKQRADQHKRAGQHKISSILTAEPDNSQLRRKKPVPQVVHSPPRKKSKKQKDPEDERDTEPLVLPVEDEIEAAAVHTHEGSQTPHNCEEVLDNEEQIGGGATTIPVDVDWDRIIRQSRSQESPVEDRNVSVSGRGQSGSIDHAASDLQMRVIAKEDFPQMKILGQFNLGFIIAELRGDLYILDQHACDEKYRFETLQQNLRLNSQPLVAPYRMHLEAADELVVAENLEVIVDFFYRSSVRLP